MLEVLVDLSLFGVALLVRIRDRDSAFDWTAWTNGGTTMGIQNVSFEFSLKHGLAQAPYA
jgi:hypothetical protein